MKKDYHKSDQKQEAIKRKMASYSTLAATFLAFSPVNDASAQIIVHDVDPDASFTSHDEAIFAGTGGYVIDINDPNNTIDLTEAEIILRIVDNTYVGSASSDFGVQIDQQTDDIANVRFVGSVAKYMYPTTNGSLTTTYAQAGKLASGFQIGPTINNVPSTASTGTGFVNRDNNSAGFQSVKIVSGYGTEWSPAGTGFLGVKFDINGKTHYGWVELDVTPLTVNPPMLPHGDNASNYNFTVTRWAYESCPDTPIQAGEETNSLCNDNDVPTLSEWGLITLAILLLSFGTLYIGRREEELIGQGTRGSNVNLGAYWQKPPLVWAIFKKTLLATGGLAVVAGVLSYLVYGTIAAVDIAGTAIAGPLFAYLMHLLWIFEGNKKDNQ